MGQRGLGADSLAWLVPVDDHVRRARRARVEGGRVVRRGGALKHLGQEVEAVGLQRRAALGDGASAPLGECGL